MFRQSSDKQMIIYEQSQQEIKYITQALNFRMKNKYRRRIARFLEALSEFFLRNLLS